MPARTAVKGFREPVPKALDSVTIPAIFHYYPRSRNIMEAYRFQLEYRTKQFKEGIFGGHKQVVDESKW